MENEYLDLPDDPEEGFAMLHRRRYAELEKVWESGDGNSGWHHERQYIDVMIAFDEVMGLNFLEGLKPVPNSDSDFSDYWQGFRRQVEIASQKILIEAARRHKAGAQTIIVFDEAQRQAIHHLIQKIREHLEAAKLTDAKREALFNKLNAFAGEVDRNRTRPEAFYAFAVETARAAKQVNDELKPLQQTIDKVFDWIEKAKKFAEALPPWSDRKKIEGPRKQLPAPERQSSNTADEDEIPF
ncbi:hypothetical protein [Rhizobium ruizarguesonis]|uniref:hypothetical protein n=1 Tax=Rhizobium ruizarguesonis TaxID=2081791 RepID=UPI0005B52EB9|nr:hypothetical protein [Rhizobium ruizarguesonis]QJS29268.1 hypothetical protein RLTA1_19000 [Rhizobium leguminosarum bv. trifolii TA1]UFW93425.1 hypothetical protein RlegTA1_18960 [Rhizobium ruizarguesonis]